VKYTASQRPSPPYNTCINPSREVPELVLVELGGLNTPAL